MLFTRVDIGYSKFMVAGALAMIFLILNLLYESEIFSRSEKKEFCRLYYSNLDILESKGEAEE